MTPDLLTPILLVLAGLAVGIWLGHLMADLTARDRQADPPEGETQDEIFTGRFGRIWKDR